MITRRRQLHDHQCLCLPSDGVTAQAPICAATKPFDLAQLRSQLEAYRLWREHASGGGEADQATVDALYNLLRGPAPAPPAGEQLPPTMQKVLDAVRSARRPQGASALAQQLGVGRPTAQRYLIELHKRGAVHLHLEYGSAGRPVHLYGPAAPDRVG
jgi:response regulator of citrate/malate metabolism